MPKPEHKKGGITAALLLENAGLGGGRTAFSVSRFPSDA
jgi:hypothetical protein